jgi:hypothetical protein
VRTPTSERRITIDVTGPAQPPIMAVPYSTVREIKAKEFLFIGHANLDGFDNTAVAKPGIDRLVEQAKKNHRPVVYWVSREYPDWYTADRRPDYHRRTRASGPCRCPAGDICGRRLHVLPSEEHSDDPPRHGSVPRATYRFCFSSAGYLGSRYLGHGRQATVSSADGFVD